MSYVQSMYGKVLMNLVEPLLHHSTRQDDEPVIAGVVSPNIRRLIFDFSVESCCFAPLRRLCERQKISPNTICRSFMQRPPSRPKTSALRLVLKIPLVPSRWKPPRVQIHLQPAQKRLNSRCFVLRCSTHPPLFRVHHRRLKHRQSYLKHRRHQGR